MLTEPISMVIVESQPILRAALSMTFASEGISVLALLSGGVEALRAAPALNPNVLLLAIGTPGWSDIQAIPSLKKLMPACAIVALVTGEIPGQESTASSQGADLVLSKSTSRSELFRAVRELSQKRIYTATVQFD